VRPLKLEPLKSMEAMMPRGRTPQYPRGWPTLPKKSIKSQVVGKVATRNTKMANKIALIMVVTPYEVKPDAGLRVLRPPPANGHPPLPSSGAFLSVNDEPR
jgi:hypothetical protein